MNTDTSTSRAIAEALVKLLALHEGAPLAQRYEAMGLECEDVADQLGESYHNPTSANYRNKDTKAKIIELRLLSYACLGFAAAMRGDRNLFNRLVREAEARGFGDHEAIWDAPGPQTDHMAQGEGVTNGG